jgi:hypothetical protein
MSGNEFFYKDKDGKKQDAALHEPILAAGDEEAARKIGMEAARIVLVAQRINDFVKGHGKPICDKCIMDGLKLTAHAHSAQITAALGTTSDFTRQHDECSVCKNDRTVIQIARS